MVVELQPELVVDARNQLGEGPVWDARTDTLFWLDVLAGVVHRYDPADGSTTETSVGQEVGALVPRSSGGHALAVRDGFATLDEHGTVSMLSEVEAGDPANRMNDGKCDRAGRFWASTMAFDASPDRGSLYRLSPDGDVDQVLTGLTIGNGLAWTADDRTFFFIDTMTRGVDAFDLDLATGTIDNKRQVVRIPEEDGLPDGMCIDAEGALWVALYSGGAVRRYSPDGELLAVVRLPVPNPTCCTFGGPDLRELYITTAWAGMSDAERAESPQAGGLFRVRTEVAGVLPYEFAG
jgi:sugar lactone lactonase YvrE